MVQCKHWHNSRNWVNTKKYVYIKFYCTVSVETFFFCFNILCFALFLSFSRIIRFGLIIVLKACQ